MIEQKARQDELSIDPWGTAPLNQETAQWRESSREGRLLIVNAVNASDRSSLSSSERWSSVRRVVEAVFQTSSLVDASDRLALVRWVGQTVAIWANILGPKPRPYCTMNMVCGLFVQRWAAIGWIGVPGSVQPDWAADLMERVYGGVAFTSSAHDRWGPIPKGWTPGTVGSQTNAQMDLVAFLSGYQMEAKKHRGLAPIQRDTTADIVADSCLALHMMGGLTDRVDPMLLDYLKPFELLYDHSSNDEETRRCVQALEDLKALAGSGHQQHNQTSGSATAFPPARRKL